MKKSLLALAVLGAFAGTASAQSSVTLYGVVDAGLQYNKQFSSATGTQESVVGLNGGYFAGNRWGLRGSEALGNGMSAIFTLESGFDIDTGLSGQSTSASGSLCQNSTTGAVTSTPNSACPTGTTRISGVSTAPAQSRLFGRQAWAGLATPFGSIVGGRIATFSSGTGSFDMFGAVDPFGAGFGINAIGSTFISANSLRVDNALAYVSPTWAGFKFGAAYSFNYSGQEGSTSDLNTKVTGLGASYSWGPLYAAVTYDIVEYPTLNPSGSAVSPASDDQTHLQLGLTWDFKFLKLYGAWADQSKIQAVLLSGGNSISVPTGVGNWNNNAWMLGATAPIGNFTLRASYQYSDADNIINRGVSFEPDYAVYGIGVDYKLSNRTLIYLGFGVRDAKGTLLSETTDRDQFALGLNHRF